MAKTGDIVRTPDGHYYRLDKEVRGYASPPTYRWWCVSPICCTPERLQYSLDETEFTAIDPFDMMVWKVQHGQS